MLNEQKSTAVQRRLARDRQRTHRAKVAQEEVQSERDQRAADNWSERRRSLQVVSLFESAPGVFCKDIHEQLEQCRYMARRTITRPALQVGDSYKSYFQRVLETWTSARWRCAGRSILTDEIVYSVRFNYRTENIPDLCAEMCAGIDPEQPIDVASLPALKWTCIAAKPPDPIDPNVQAHHDALDESRRDEQSVRNGKFSIIDDAQNFKITPHGSDGAYKFPRSHPTDLLWCSWNILKLADLYLRKNAEDIRFDPDTRARIHRVWTFHLQSTKTNFNRGLEE